MLETTVQPNTASPEETSRVALLVEYCGTAFNGSQFQPDLPTVQQVVQDALRRLNLETSAVTFAGRTDAGVHARGQVGHFDVAAGALKNVPNLPLALNSKLPDTVSVREVCLNAGTGFHSRREATGKWYRYQIYNGRHRSVWGNRLGAAHVTGLLDAERMDKAARLLLGRHDFAAFKGSDTDVTDDICRFHHVQVVREGDFINFDVVGDRFLYKMVRNIVGQLIAIGSTEEPQPAERILEVLAGRDRRQAAATAPAHGLTLMAVSYPAPYDFFGRDPYVRHLENLLNQTEMESPQNENLYRKAS